MTDVVTVIVDFTDLVGKSKLRVDHQMSRVPCIGEHIDVADQVYKVWSVIHLTQPLGPNAAVAQIRVSPT